MAKGLRFFALFGELPSQPSGNPREYRLEFWFEGFTGTSMQVEMGGEGFSVSELSSDDEIQGVKAKRYSIQIARKYNDTWTAKDFFTLAEEDVEIRLYDRNADALLEKGYLTGETLTDPYHDATKLINLEATCGLRRLKDRQYVTAEGKVRRGLTSLQNKLIDCLKQTNLGLKIRISHHLQAVPMSPLNNSGLIVANEELHYIDDTSYDVLDKIARSANLTIFQDNGIWHIVHFFSKITGPRTYDEYDAQGNFLGTGTFAISNPAIHNGPIQPRDGDFIFEPALKKVTVTWRLGRYKNYLLNDNFEDFNGTSFANWELVGNLSFDNPGGYLARTGTGIKGNPYRLKMGGYADEFLTAAFMKQTYVVAERPDLLFEERLRKQIIFSGSAWAKDVVSITALMVLDFIVDQNIKFQFYLTSSGQWAAFRGNVRDGIAISTLDPNGKSKNSEFKWEIASPRIDTLPLNGRVGTGGSPTAQLTLAQVTRVELSVTLRQGVGRPKNPFAGTTFDPYVEYANIGMQIIDVATNLNIKEIKYVAENQAKATRKHEMEAFVGDFVDSSQNACLQFISGEITKQWYSDEDSIQREFLAYTARDYLRSRSKPRTIWEGNLWGKWSMISLFTLAEESDKFVLTKYEYKYHRGWGNVRISQLNSDEPNITIKKFATLTDGSEIEMPLDGSLTTPEVINPYMGVQVPANEGTQDIEPNIFNLPNLTTIERGQLVFNTADNPFLGFQFADLSDPTAEPVITKSIELKADAMALVNNDRTVNIKMDFLNAGAVANLTVAPLGTADETIATRQWANTVFQPLDADLTALAALNTIGVIRRTGAGTMSTMSGTVNRVVKWGAGGALVDGIMVDDGVRVGIGATVMSSSVLTISGGQQFTSSNGNAYNLLISTNVIGRRSGETVAQIGTFDNNSAIELGAGNSGAAISLGGNNVPGGSEIKLWTTNAMRMRFSSDGRLGIGNYENLQINGRIEINTGALGMWITRVAGDAGVNTAAMLIGTTPTQVRLHTHGNLEFFTGAIGGALAIRATITTGGNVLIGTTTDTGERLQVNGTARISTSLATPIIGNPAGVTANNTWTYSANVNVPLVPIASAHATSKQYVDNLVATGIKEGDPVRTISLTNITLSGTQTVSGVALVAGDRVLVAGQTAATQNGVYIVAAGAWTRATDSDIDAELRGFQYLITAGSQINAKYRNSNQTAITIGTTAITYVISQGAETDPIFTASPAFGITAQNIINWNAVHSVWGALVPTPWWDSQLATKTTDNVTEGASNLYYTNTRARAAISSAATGLNYNNETGVLSLASGRVIPTSAELAALQPLDADLTAIAALSENGLLRKTAGIWGMDASVYLTGNQAITISGDATGSGSTSIALTLANSGVTAGIYRSVSVDAKGRVTAGTNPTTLAGYGITDAQPLNSNLTAIAALSENGLLRKTSGVWGMDASVYLTGNQTITISGDATGSGSTTIALTLANSGVTAGTYRSVSVDAKGRVTAGTNPTTLAGYGITDAQPLNSNLTTIAALNTNGLLRRSSGVWGIDTATYLTTQAAALAYQPIDADLTAIAALGTTGTLRRTASNTWQLYTPAIADITGLQTALDAKQPLDSDLTAIAALSENGLLRKTSGVWGMDASVYLTGNQTITISGDATGSGSTTIALTLANSGVTAGIYRSVSVDAKGRVTAGTNPTTLAGYGITDAQPLNPNLTTIAGLSTNGLLRRSSGVWGIDSATYLTTQAAALAYQPLDADLTAIAALSTTGTLRRTAGNTWQLYTPAISDITGLSTALAAKQDINTRLTALITMSGTGVVQWNGTAFSSGNITIPQVVDLASTIDTLWILRDRNAIGPVAGFRDFRSIIFEGGNRMDFGFDRVLDVPYLYYSTAQGDLVNFMDADGRWNNVAIDGTIRKYAFLGEGGGTGIAPTLQEVSERGSNSSIRLKFNGINYALEAAVPNLQSVAAAGSNSNIRLSLNGVGYATLNEIAGGGGGSVGNLGQVLAQGNNTNGIDINLNGFGVIRTQQVGGQSEILIGNNANIQLASFNTIRTNATNVFTNAQTINMQASLEVSLGVPGGISGVQNGIFVRGDLNFLGGGFTDIRNIAREIRFESETLLLYGPGGLSATTGTMGILMPEIIIGKGDTNTISLRGAISIPAVQKLYTPQMGDVNFNFHPSTFTNNQKYVFQYTRATNTMNMVPA